VSAEAARPKGAHVPEVIWHDVECGAYAEDLPLWRDLAISHAGPVLDVGAGTGRVTLHLAGQGHRVVALDRSPDLLAALRSRAGGLPVETVEADAREFDLGERRFGLILVPMQTVQLLGGPEGRAPFLRCARAALAPGGLLAIAIADALETFDEVRCLPPIPDIREIDGIVYASRPVAVTNEPDGAVIRRIRETVDTAGRHTVEEDLISLDHLEPATLEAEGAAAGFRVSRARAIPETDDYVGSTVVMLRG
jgi:SAM-dependent methyltransferase